MIKCANCGSTTPQLVKQYNIRSKSGQWIEEYKCNCGCTITRRVQVREEVTRYNGTLIKYDYNT